MNFRPSLPLVVVLGCASALLGAAASSGCNSGTTDADDGYTVVVPDAGPGAHDAGGGAGGAQGGQGGSGGLAGQGGAGGNAASGGSGQAGAGGEAGSGGFRLRVVAGNLTSNSAQTYDGGHGIRIFQGLRPDVALIQELNYGDSSSEDIRTFVDVAFGSSFSYTRESGATIPNGIVSRYPLLGSGVWSDPQVSNREFVWARIDLPGSAELWAVSVHWLTTSSGDRSAEAEALVDAIANQVPNGALLVVGGDLNTDTRGENCISVLASRFVTGSPYPVDNVGDSDTNGTRTKPYDWVLASPALDSLEVPVAIGAQSFAAGLVFDSRIYTPLADVAPVLENDSGATNMQHMAVVRDFFVP